MTPPPPMGHELPLLSGARTIIEDVKPLGRLIKNGLSPYENGYVFCRHCGYKLPRCSHEIYVAKNKMLYHLCGYRIRPEARYKKGRKSRKGHTKVIVLSGEQR